jgi:hypothetical protein
MASKRKYGEPSSWRYKMKTGEGRRRRRRLEGMKVAEEADGVPLDRWDSGMVRAKAKARMRSGKGRRDEHSQQGE